MRCLLYIKKTDKNERRISNIASNFKVQCRKVFENLYLTFLLHVVGSFTLIEYYNIF